jgi:hypothetical protein
MLREKEKVKGGRRKLHNEELYNLTFYQIKYDKGPNLGDLHGRCGVDWTDRLRQADVNL